DDAVDTDGPGHRGALRMSSHVLGAVRQSASEAAARTGQSVVDVRQLLGSPYLTVCEQLTAEMPPGRIGIVCLSRCWPSTRMLQVIVPRRWLSASAAATIVNFTGPRWTTSS